MRARGRSIVRTVVGVALLAVVAGLAGPVGPVAATLATSDDDSGTPGVATVIGWVLDEHGDPVGGVDVRAYVKDHSHPDVVATTDGEGRYELTGLALAPYHLVALPDGGPPAWYPYGVATEAESDVLEHMALGERSFVAEDLVVGDLKTMRSTSLPELSGDSRVNAFMFASQGTWSEPGVRPLIRWYVDGKMIGSETGWAFLPREADFGKRVVVKVAATKPGFRTVIAHSVASAPVEPGSMVTDDVLTVSGERAVGSTLRASRPAWRTRRGPASVRSVVTWTRNDSVVGTGPHYRVSSRDVGATLKVRLVATRSAHRPGTATARAAVGKVRSRTSVTVRSAERGRVALRVAVRAAGQVRPRGTLVVKDGRKVVRRLSVPRSGRATVRLSGLRDGRHTLTAVYVGDGATKRSHDRARVTVRR